MKKYALMVSLAVCAISACTIGARAQAGTMASVASLSITSGSPAAAPNPVLTGQPSIVNFNVTLSVSGSGAELTGNDVSSQTYTISAGSGSDPNDNMVESVSAPGFTVTIASDGHSATLTSGANGDSQTPSVSASVQYTTPGQKTITMSGSATFADGSSVSTNPSGSVSLNVVQVSLSSSMHPTYVHLKGNYMDAFSTLNCQAQITPAVAGSTQSFSVTLTNPQHEVEFAAGTSDSITLSLAANGTAQPFDITGVAPSGAVGEAVVQASSPTGSVVGTMPSTVYSFSAPNLVIQPDGAYILQLGYFSGSTVSTVQNQVYLPDNDYAVTMRATLTLEPRGLDATAPQIAAFKLGIQQNMDGGSIETDTLAPPTVNDPTNQWQSSAQSGVTYNVPSLVTTVTGLPGSTNDTGIPGDPNYDSIFYVRTAPLLSTPATPANNPYVQTPMETHDTPGASNLIGNYITKDFYAMTPSGYALVLTPRYYKISVAHYQESFHDWAVLAQYNSSNALVARTNLLEATWNLNVRSDLSNQIATANTSGPVVPPSPVDGPVANISDSIAYNWGATTYPFTCP